MLLNVGQRCPTNLFDKIVGHKDIDKIIIRKNLLAMSPKVVNFILNLTNNFKCYATYQNCFVPACRRARNDFCVMRKVRQDDFDREDCLQ